ncbi:MAG: electron transfer flavoprotein subunit beta/FixA family protein [Saprospiraceae bacterium]|nr:electron transfer flavoprotein subunit beta/FixA family protein [Saprospiraceae bacterium]
MKILVCISKTPETTSKIKFSEDATELMEDGLQYILNPYDEWYALVRAVELKEEFEGSVTVINVGPASNDTVIRKALAIGADDAVRINVEPASAMSVANHISDYATGKDYDLILLGKESIDYNGSVMGAMLSEFLNLPFIAHASGLTKGGDAWEIERGITGGTERVRVNGTVVVSAAKGMAEQRIPNMRGIMMAKRKPLEVIEAENKASSLETVGYAYPAEKTAVKMIDPNNMEELVRLLQEEAKVI